MGQGGARLEMARASWVAAEITKMGEQQQFNLMITHMQITDRGNDILPDSPLESKKRFYYTRDRESNRVPSYSRPPGRGYFTYRVLMAQ